MKRTIQLSVIALLTIIGTSFGFLTKTTEESSLRDQLLGLYQDTCRIHYHLFEDDFFKQKFFSSEDKDGDNILSYILPSVRRVFVTFFMNVPTLFENDPKRKDNTMIAIE